MIKFIIGMIKNIILTKVKVMKNSNPKYQILNVETGEIMGDYVPKSRRKSTHEYYLVFARNLSDAGINVTALEQAILLEMNAKNIISLSETAQNDIMQRNKINLDYLRHAFVNMCKKGLVLRISQSVYFANPIFVTKSSCENIYALRSEYLSFLTKISSTKKSKSTKNPAEKENKILVQVQNVLNNSKPFNV